MDLRRRVLHAVTIRAVSKKMSSTSKPDGRSREELIAEIFDLKLENHKLRVVSVEEERSIPLITISSADTTPASSPTLMDYSPLRSVSPPGMEWTGPSSPVSEPDVVFRRLVAALQGFELIDVNLRKIAETMPGASGAEVKGVCTEAGMYALKERRFKLTQLDFEMAVDKIMQKDSEKNMSIKKLCK